MGTQLIFKVVDVLDALSRMRGKKQAKAAPRPKKAASQSDNGSDVIDDGGKAKVSAKIAEDTNTDTTPENKSSIVSTAKEQTIEIPTHGRPRSGRKD